MHFRRLAVSLALVLPVAACQPAGTPSPSFTVADSTAIRGLLTQYAATVVAQDWAAHVRYYTTDAVRMPPNEPVMRGHAAITAWDTALPPVTGFTLTPRVVVGDGNLAYASGAFTFDLAPPGAAPVNMVGKWQATYQRQADGSWLCVSDIWNADTPITPITT
jgi:ketosteroid isomerase-like protein